MTPGDRLYEHSNAHRQEADCLFHYTTKGTGTFRDESTGQEDQVPAGSAFLIPIPSQSSYWNNPPLEWECMWIFFNGEIARKLVDQLIQNNNGNHVFQLHPDGPSVQALHKLHRLRMNGEPHPAQANGILYEILCGLFCPAEEPLPEAIQKACRFINQHFNNPELNVHMVAEACGLSRSHFSREFTKFMDCNPNAYITKIRLQKAFDLILSFEHKMKDIAQLVGFAEPGYFNAVFKKTYGYPPGHIRKSRK